MILSSGIVSPDDPGEVLAEQYTYKPSFCVKEKIPGYLTDKPAVIHLSGGRQLFVDDFLIDRTDLERKFYQAEMVEENPILEPRTSAEMDNGICPVAAPFKDGICFDPADRKYKLWYQAGWFGGVAYAESFDGISWFRPPVGIAGTNLVIPRRKERIRDGCCVWMDPFEPACRYKMFLFSRDKLKREYSELRTSENGVLWSDPVYFKSGGDTTSFFYNPFRNKWALSVRCIWEKGRFLYRYRSYREADSFLGIAKCEKEYFWQSADEKDLRDEVYDCDPQLYSLDCVAYESVMLGMFQVYTGPHNDIAGKLGSPKQCNLYLGFSRDGLVFSRLNRKAFISGTKIKGHWREGYIHPAGGICIVRGDELFFYFGAWSGNSPKNGRHMYAGGSTGVAKLRRDGFASLGTDTTGYVETPAVDFYGEALWVNAACEGIRIEIQSVEGHPLPGLSFQECIEEPVYSTKKRIRWKKEGMLKKYAGIPVRIVFKLKKGELFSFWFSDYTEGKSRGYLAAGSVGHKGIRDD